MKKNGRKRIGLTLCNCGSIQKNRADTWKGETDVSTQKKTLVFGAPTCPHTHAAHKSDEANQCRPVNCMFGVNEHHHSKHFYSSRYVFHFSLCISLSFSLSLECSFFLSLSISLSWMVVSQLGLCSSASFVWFAQMFPCALSLSLLRV